jgi:phosphate transport system substrate-binding protein
VRATRLVSLVAIVSLAGAFSPAGALASSGLTGTGSSVVAPLIAEWSAAFGAFFGTPISYDPAGSLAGITAVSSRTVDFGASDAPMTSAQRSTCGGCYQIPVALGALGIGYHVDGLNSKLRLSGTLLAEIYQGQITRWNDPRIRALNPGASLPNLRVVPIYTGAAGSTYTFTTYLSKVSTSWRHRVGSGLSVSFPTGVPADNATVSALLQSTNGAVAYVGASYLIAERLPAAAIENSAGQFEYPNLSEIESAARTVKHVPAGNAIDIVDPPKGARSAYPIATFTYMIVPANDTHKSLLERWLAYALGPGQAFGESLDFATIPSIVLRASNATASQFAASS